MGRHVQVVLKLAIRYQLLPEYRLTESGISETRSKVNWQNSIDLFCVAVTEKLSITLQEAIRKLLHGGVRSETLLNDLDE